MTYVLTETALAGSECACGGQGFVEIDYGISVMRQYCDCAAGIEYKARSMEAMGL